VVAAKNTGLPYERIVQSIFQAILGQDRARNIAVEHDVKLIGKSGEQHQIDVYWEFEVGGVSYKTLVSAKDWAGNVKKEQVLSFKTILDDIAGQPRGVIVTRQGYQSGAEGFAKHHGITLYVVRKPDDEFWEGRTRKLVLETRFFEPTYSRLGFVTDRAWLDELQRARGQQQFQITFRGGSDQLFLIGESGQRESIHEALPRLFPTPAFEVVARHRAIHTFSEAVYLGPLAGELESVRLASISADVEQTMTAEETVVFDGDDVVDYIIEDVLKDERRVIGKDGTVEGVD
jgi:hypothetical protein